MQFSNKSMFESAQQIKKIYLDDCIFNHQWIRVTNIVLHNLQSTGSMTLSTKTPPGNRITGYQQKKRKKKKEKEHALTTPLLTRSY